MKKILVMNIGTELGGIEKSLVEFLRFLVEEECEIDLALWKRRGPLFDEIPQNIKIIENIGPGEFSDIRKSKGWNKIGKIGYYFKFKIFAAYGNAWKSVPKMNETYDIAISYCQNGYSPYYIIDKVTANKKYLWFHHGVYDGKEKEKKRDEKYYSLYDKLITVSKANKEMLYKKFPSATIEVIHNLVDENKIHKLSKEKVEEFENFSGLKIVSVGRLSEEKGHVQSIETAKKLNEKGVNFKWLFIGDGPLRVQCEELVASYNLQDKCLFLGAKKNPYSYMQCADLYVQTSLVESEAITIREAIILKKMVIATDLPAVRETLFNGTYGCLCPNDSESFVDKIIYYSDKDNQKDILSNISEKESINIQIKHQIKKLLDI